MLQIYSFPIYVYAKLVSRHILPADSVSYFPVFCLSECIRSQRLLLMFVCCLAVSIDTKEVEPTLWNRDLRKISSCGLT